MHSWSFDEECSILSLIKGLKLNRPKSSRLIAAAVMIQSGSLDLDLCPSSCRAFVRSDRFMFGIFVIIKLLFRSLNISSSIDSHLQIVKDNLIPNNLRVSKLIEHRWTVAHHNVVFHHCGICEDSFIEDAHRFISAHVEEVLAFDCDLGVAIVGTALRLDRGDDRMFVVEELDGFGVEILLHRDT